MSKQFFAINKTKTYAEIRIYGVIGSSYWDEEDNTASRFINELKAVEAEFDDIRIRINSPGGDIGEGLPMFNLICQSTKNISIIVDGIAMSMGAFIACAGKTVRAPKASMFMLHGAATIEMGNAAAFRETADVLDKWNEVLIAGIAAARNLKPEDVRAKWFADGKDHYLTADEAFAEGLIDEVIEGAADVPANISAMDYKQILATYRSVKPSESLLNFGKRVAAELFPKKQIVPPTNSEKEMKTAVCALLGLALAASDEDIVASTQKVLAERNDFKAKLDNAEALRVKAEGEHVAAVALVAERDATIVAMQATIDKKPAGALGAVGGTDTPPAGGPPPVNTFVDPVTAYAESLKG